MLWRQMVNLPHKRQREGEREKERDWMAQMEDLSRDPRGRFNDASTIWRVPGGRGLNMLITPTKPRCVCVLSIKPAASHTHTSESS